MTEPTVLTRACLGAVSVGDGPTREQLNILDHLARGYFGVAIDLERLTPLSPNEAAAQVDAGDYHRLIDLMIVLEFCRHPADLAQADRVEAYARAFGEDEPFLIVARDALKNDRAAVAADWERFREPLCIEPGIDATEDVADQMMVLRNCPPASLGRGLYDFYRRWGLQFPDNDRVDLVCHDFTHVISGYEPMPVGEIALQAMLTSATNFNHHFSTLVATLAFSETGNIDFPDAAPKTESLNRHGAAEALADALRRGKQCGQDFEGIDHMAMIDRPLDDVRRELGIVGSKFTYTGV
jgi:hypothetical protein